MTEDTVYITHHKEPATTVNNNAISYVHMCSSGQVLC